MADRPEENFRILKDYLVRRIPQVRTAKPEDPAFAWLDFSRVADTPAQMTELLRNQPPGMMAEGAQFSGRSWMSARLRLDCPESDLRKALEQLETDVKIRLSECYSTEWIMEWYREV